MILYALEQLPSFSPKIRLDATLYPRPAKGLANNTYNLTVGYGISSYGTGAYGTGTFPLSSTSNKIHDTFVVI